MRFTRERSALWTLPLGAVLLSLTLAAPAHADTVPSDSDQPVLSSTLTITNSDGTSSTTSSTGTLQSVQDVTPADDVDSDQPAQVAPQTATTRSVASPAVAGPQGSKLLCNKFYKFSDANLSYTVQHQCGSNTVPWGIKLSPAACATATGLVTEAPQHWTKNGKTQTAQSGHTVNCSYQFHGNYSGLPDGTHIAYSGVYTWRVKGNGTATLQVHGSFTATGNQCGSATSC